MKIFTKVPDFEPVTIEILLETQTEVDAMYALAKADFVASHELGHPVPGMPQIANSLLTAMFDRIYSLVKPRVTPEQR